MNQSMSQKLTDDQFMKAYDYAFNHYDKDKDNRLNMAEFKTMYNSLNVMQKKTFSFEITPQIMEHLFRQYDGNKDGFVEKADFYQILRRAYFS